MLIKALRAGVNWNTTFEIKLLCCIHGLATLAVTTRSLVDLFRARDSIL